MSTDIATRDDVRALVDESTQILNSAKEFKIATNVTFQLAADELKRIKGAMKRLDDLRTSITKPMTAAKNAVMDLFRSPSERLESAERVIKAAMVAYQTELDSQAREQRAAAERAASEEQERLAASAASAVDRGDFDRAETLWVQSQTAPAPAVLPREAPKVAGLSFREVWKFEITDAAAIPREYLVVDESKIRRVVQAMKVDTRIPGVRVYPDKQPASTAA